MLTGKPIVCWAALMALTASPRAMLGARLKKTVTDGKRPWWLTWMGPVPVPNFVTAVSGICSPLRERC
jgi:hypothetical protein